MDMIRSGLRDRIAEALLDHLSRTADIRPSRDGALAFMPEVTDAERWRMTDAVLAALPAAHSAAPAICKIPHATTDEEDACERQRLAGTENARAAYRKLRAHLVGFQDVLHDSDRGPWAATVGADLDELGALLDPSAPLGNPSATEETR